MEKKGEGSVYVVIISIHVNIFNISVSKKAYVRTITNTLKKLIF